MYLYHIHTWHLGRPTEGARSLSCRLLWVVMCVLGTQPRSSAKVANTLNWAISPAHLTLTCKTRYWDTKERVWGLDVANASSHRLETLMPDSETKDGRRGELECPCHRGEQTSHVPYNNAGWSDSFCQVAQAMAYQKPSLQKNKTKQSKKELSDIPVHLGYANPTNTTFMPLINIPQHSLFASLDPSSCSEWSFLGNFFYEWNVWGSVPKGKKGKTAQQTRQRTFPLRSSIQEQTAAMLSQGQVEILNGWYSAMPRSSLPKFNRWASFLLD